MDTIEDCVVGFVRLQAAVRYFSLPVPLGEFPCPLPVKLLLGGERRKFFSERTNRPDAEDNFVRKAEGGG